MDPTKRAVADDAKGRRFFVPIGVSNPGGAFRPLHVAEDVARLHDVFVDSFGYRRVGIDDNPSFGELRAALIAWLAEAALTRADDVVVYYTGHGHLDALGELYLCTRGFSTSEPGNAMRVDALVELVLGRDARPGKLWLILDCCHAGGALDGGLFERVFRRLRGAYVLVASSTFGLARDGAFGEAFAQAARAQRSRRSLSGLAAAVQDNLRESGQVVACFEVGPAEFDFLVDRRAVQARDDRSKADRGPHRGEPHQRDPREPVGAAASRSPVREGDVIDGKYRVGRVLGEGGMGVIVAATHLRLDETFALKFLLPEGVEQPEVVARFLREAKAAVRIRSEHVGRVMDVGVHDGRLPYMVMEYLEGEDMGRALERRGRLPIAEAVDIVVQACEALAEAHVLGIVHRDLKPANLFLAERPSGTPILKVLDFGISKVVAGDDPGLTRTATTLGTVLYMSPEQSRASPMIDARSDIWSLGVVLYELLTGTTPFEGDSLGAIVGKILSVAPAPLRALRPDVPPLLEAVIVRCLERAPENRFGNVAEFAAAVAPFGPYSLSESVNRIAHVVGAVSPHAVPGMTVVGEPPGPAVGKSSHSAEWARSAVEIPARPASSTRFVLVVLIAIVAGLVGAEAWRFESRSSPWTQTAATNSARDPSTLASVPDPSTPTSVPVASNAAPGASPPLVVLAPEVNGAAQTDATPARASPSAWVVLRAPFASPPPHDVAPRPMSASSPSCARLLERLGLGDELGPQEKVFFEEECKR